MIQSLGITGTMLSFSDIRRTIEFIKRQPDGTNVRQYIVERSNDLEMTNMEVVEDLATSANDYYYDLN